MNKDYLTIKDYGENEIIINKSRFICYINRASTEQIATTFIKKIKKTNYTATHNCQAYIIGKDAMSQKANDDGEPSGTAGVPMLEVLRKNNLTDTVCVVTRYFGGVKLGAGGLIRAYSSAVSKTIKKVGIIVRKNMQVFKITANYSQIGILDSILSNYDIIKRTFLDKVYYEVIVDLKESDNFLKWFINTTNDKILISKDEIIIKEIDYKK